MPSKKTILKFLDKAKQDSLKSNFPRQGVGCVAVIGNKQIAIGHNTTKSHPKQKEYNKYRNFEHPEKDTGTIHAEINVLQKIRHLDLDFEDVVLYVGRQKKDGSQGCAKPCKACQKLIKEMGIGTVYYTEDDNSEECKENGKFDIL